MLSKGQIQQFVFQVPKHTLADMKYHRLSDSTPHARMTQSVFQQNVNNLVCLHEEAHFSGRNVARLAEKRGYFYKRGFGQSML